MSHALSSYRLKNKQVRIVRVLQSDAAEKTQSITHLYRWVHRIHHCKAHRTCLWNPCRRYRYRYQGDRHHISHGYCREIWPPQDTLHREQRRQSISSWINQINQWRNLLIYMMSLRSFAFWNAHWSTGDLSRCTLPLTGTDPQIIISDNLSTNPNSNRSQSEYLFFGFN